MNKTITTKKNAFEVNFFNKSIAGTKSAFNKASKGEGAHYEELTRLMAQHPDFRLVIKEQKIQKEKKETYEGLTFELMKEYISIQKNSTALMEAFEEVKKFAKESAFIARIAATAFLSMQGICTSPQIGSHVNPK